VSDSVSDTLDDDDATEPPVKEVEGVEGHTEKRNQRVVSTGHDKQGDLLQPSQH